MCTRVIECSEEAATSGNAKGRSAMKRELQGDRPPPLKVHREPQKNRRAPLPIPPVQFRPPVIIHTYSPKVIQTDANNFMQLVQRLTGPGSPNSPPLPKRAKVLHSERSQLQPATLLPNDDNQHPVQNTSTSNSIGKLQFLSSANVEHGPHNTQQRSRPGLLGVSPRGILPRPVYHGNSEPGALAYNSLLSPSFFDFSPSMLPSPSALYSSDFPSLLSPTTLPSPRAPNNFSHLLSTPTGVPTPGPLTAGFLSELPSLSPAAYRWIESSMPADTISSRAYTSFNLPPRPPGQSILPSPLPSVPNPFLSEDTVSHDRQ